MDALNADARADARARDADIAAQLAHGEHEAAFDALANRYAAKMFRLCLTLVGDEATAQDTTQDALLRIWRALGSYREERAALSTWIYAITRNRCMSVLEHRRPRHQTHSLEDAWEEVALLPAPCSAPANQADSLALLRQLVSALPDAARQCVELYYFEERAVLEVAALLGLPEGTVKTHLHRARTLLLQALRRAGLGDAQLWL